MSNQVDCKDLKPEVVLAALYNNSKPLGMGFHHYNPEPMTAEQAAEELESTNYFDYLHGRVMKVSFRITLNYIFFSLLILLLEILIYISLLHIFVPFATRFQDQISVYTARAEGVSLIDIL